MKKCQRVDVKSTERQTDVCRQEFEKWATDKYSLRVLSSNEDYVNDMTTIAYHGWCAAWKAARQDLNKELNITSYAMGYSDGQFKKVDEKFKRTMIVSGRNIGKTAALNKQKNGKKNAAK